MNRLAIRHLSCASAALSLVGLAALVSACGGGELTTAGPEARPMAVSAADIVQPLLDDEGLPSLSVPEAVPRDPAARRPDGLYATAAQAEQLEHALGAAAISVRVRAAHEQASTTDALDDAVRFARTRQAALRLDADAPVLVRGDDTRRTAAVATQLQALGFRRVFLVKP